MDVHIHVFIPFKINKTYHDKNIQVCFLRSLIMIDSYHDRCTENIQIYSMKIQCHYTIGVDIIMIITVFLT